ncbi:MAG: phasin family protein [Usitatibacteraceae bacterium]
MATKRIVKKVVAKAKAPTNTKARAKTVARKVGKASAAAVDANPVKKAVLASLGAAERMQQRVQERTTKIYGGMVDVLARETSRITGMSEDTTKAVAEKAKSFVREGQKVQSNAQAAAQAKALEVVKEIKTLAAKSEHAFKKNVKGTVDTTMANAKDGITKLEHVFEARVAKTLNTFGIPSSQNVRELQARMADLQKALVQLNKRGVRA